MTAVSAPVGAGAAGAGAAGAGLVGTGPVGTGPGAWRTLASLRAVPAVLPGRAQLWLFAVAAPVADAVRALLSEEERARAVRFHHERDRRAFVHTHAFVRRLLAAHLGGTPADVPIAQRAGAKPTLPETAGLRFNLSHSDGWALVGLATHEIGVDIEAIRPMPERDAIARGNFAPAEVAALAALPDHAREAGFFACWTRKEAYVKAVGLGLAAPLDRFTVSVAPEDRATLIDIADDPAAVARWTMWAGRPAPGIWAAAAVAARPCAFDLFRCVAA